MPVHTLKNVNKFNLTFEFKMHGAKDFAANNLCTFRLETLQKEEKNSS